MTQETKQCQNCKQDFMVEPEDFVFYEKMQVPSPTFCPDCRFQRRLTFMNTRTLYRRNCDLCGKSIVAMYQKGASFPVYCLPCWWSDKWDPLSYGRGYDSQKPFLEQLGELIKETPHACQAVDYMSVENSEYVNAAGHLKNCYLIYVADYCENCFHSSDMANDKDCIDGLMFGYCELCYEIIDSGRCYRSFFSEDCESCQDIAFCKACTGCSNCFGCANLKNKQYHIWNKPYSKDEYVKKVAEYDLKSRKCINELKETAWKHWAQYPVKYTHGLRNYKCTGDYVFDSKNAKQCHITLGAEDSKFCQELTLPPTRDAYDYTQWGNNAEKIYESIIVGEGASEVKFSVHCWPNVRDVECCIWTLSSAHMFGCVNVKKQEYCILNKRYTKEEFEKLKRTIRENMDAKPYRDNKGNEYRYGEFFPQEFSQFAYNETVAMKYFPMTKEEAEEKNFRWKQKEENAFQITMRSEDIPDTLEKTEDKITQEILECETCKKAFRIVPNELALYRTLGIAVPGACPDCRYQARLKRIAKHQLYQRTCMCGGEQSKNGTYVNEGTHAHGRTECNFEFETSYAPDSPNTIYCEACYQAELV